jgi:predicted tellurium resistance membrane protein TerC
MISAIFTLAMLVLLQAVLGFDNLLYISIESKRVEESRQSYVRRVGLVLAIALRIVLLVVVVKAIDYFQNPFFEIQLTGIVEGAFNVHAFIVLLGGGFILYTAVKEITHMLTIHELDQAEGGDQRTVGQAIFWIVVMNLIFSFDSILSALALTKNIWIMTTAIVISGLMMIYLSDRVSEFLKKNRMYEVLGLFILFIVGVMLLSEGGHLAHLKIAGFAIEPMAKSTFYFVIAVLVVIDIVQGRYQKKLLAQAARERSAAPATAKSEA